MTIYEEIGLPRVINASGRMTVLGVSTISDKVAKAAVAGGQSYVALSSQMDSLLLTILKTWLSSRRSLWRL